MRTTNLGNQQCPEWLSALLSRHVPPLPQLLGLIPVVINPEGTTVSTAMMFLSSTGTWARPSVTSFLPSPAAGSVVHAQTAVPFAGSKVCFQSAAMVTEPSPARVAAVT